MPDAIGTARGKVRREAEVVLWTLSGLKQAAEGMGPAPESVLRATAEAVQ